MAFKFQWAKRFLTGVDKLQEWGAPLPGNDMENLGNHHIGVNWIFRG